MISTSARWRVKAMTIELVGALLEREGKEVLLTVELCEGDKRDRRALTLPRAIYEGLEIPDAPATLSKEAFCEIEYADEQYRAIRKAFDILAYGRNSAKTLAAKLRGRGFSAEIAEDAASYMLAHGYIKEDDDAIREADLCFAKHWGSRRILMHLHEKRFDDAAIATAREYLGTLDFVDNCVKLIRSKYGTLPKEEKERNRVISGLVRYGYSFTEIKAAAKIVEYYRLPGNI